MEPKIYITYEMAFDDEPMDVRQYLKGVKRDTLVKIALFIIQSKGKYEQLSDFASVFFCQGNASFAEKSLKEIYNKISIHNTNHTSAIRPSYFIISETTGLELLRQAFAIESFETPDSQIIQEQNIFKAILIINSNISHAEVELEYTETGDLSDMFFAKLMICNSLNNYEETNIAPEYLIMLQVIKGYYFFKYCENSKLKEHLSLFLERNGLTSWEQYLYNAIKLLLFPYRNNDGYSTILLNDEGEGYSFLHSHAFSKDTVIPIEKNNDYTYFKSHPLIEVDEKTFIPINTRFCVNHLFKSIYFEFKSINEALKGTEYYFKGRGLLTIFTTEFSEQYLFDMFMRKTLKKRNGIKLSDGDCKAIANIGHEPDFYFRDGNNILLFENKDIMIADYIKRSGKYVDLEKIINQKLVKEAGISQLVHNIQSINSKSFVWDKSLPKNPRIYPIIVLDDSSLCVPGLNYILNAALEKSLKNGI